MTYYMITKDGEPTGKQTPNIMAAFVGLEFLKEVEPNHVWEIEEIEVQL